MTGAGRGLAALAAMLVAGCGGCQDSRVNPPGAALSPAAGGPAATVSAPGDPAEIDCFVIVDAEPDFGAPPLTVSFTTEVDCTGYPVSFNWDFGDGSASGNEPKPTHTYAKTGDYVAVVTVTAPDGGRGTDEIDITVDPDLGG